MKPNGMMLRRTVKPLHHLSRIRDVSWLRRDQRGLSLSRGRSRDSGWADRSVHEETPVRTKKKAELGTRTTHLHAPTVDVFNGVSIVHKCHIEWRPVQNTKRPFQGRSIAHISFGLLEQPAQAVQAGEHPVSHPKFTTV